MCIVDITDYFNYGFTEETWRAYCKRQIELRLQKNLEGSIPVLAANNQRSRGSAGPPPPSGPGRDFAQRRYEPRGVEGGFRHMKRGRSLEGPPSRPVDGYHPPPLPPPPPPVPPLPHLILVLLGRMRRPSEHHREEIPGIVREKEESA
eukprot:g33919.t1